VRERALLRAGDSLSLGDCRMLVRDDADLDARDTALPTESRCTVALRPVAGPLSGRVVAVGDRLELGSTHGALPLELPGNDPALMVLAWDDGELVLDASRVPARHAVRVNGIKTVQASLQPRDQVGIAAHRFIVDGPGWVAEPVVTVPEPEPDDTQEPAEPPRGDVWWLILTAALLALGIAAVLFVHF